MEPIIQLKNVYKSYGPRQVLKGIDLEIYPGQIIGYIGPNGAGKSTTVKILCGLINDYEGSVTIKGLDAKKDILTIKSIIGYIPELADMYDVLTPFEFLGFIGQLYHMPEELINDRMTRILRAFGMEENLHQRMDTFSKGMRQKILIASGIMHDPEIIILDEPLSGLDANSVIIIKELISGLAKQGKTIFYCSHMMDIVEKVSDRIVLIDQGRVIANGTFQELRQNRGNDSLETIFSEMTSTESPSLKAHDLINLFEKAEDKSKS
ncbi:MAG: ABC transporter ATP-binding protein [Chitinophagaceae bacterium]